MAKKIIDFDWIYKKEELDKNSVNDKFVILSNRRDLRATKVRKLVSLLNKEQHFDTPLMVNVKDGKYRLLDGNHRIEAIKHFIKDNDEKRVVVGICMYRDLDAEQEREMFTKWNLGTKQNASDFIKQYWSKIPIANKMNKSAGFTCDVGYKASDNKIDIRLLTIGYIQWLEQSNQSIGFYHDAMEFVEKLKNLEQKDYNILKQFMNEFVPVFGEPDKKSHYYRTSVFLAIQQIWLRNKQNKLPEQVMKRMAKLLGHERVLYWREFGAQRGVVDRVIVDFLAVMNAGCKTEKNLLV